jgi:catecholate siderophore receptor
MSGTERKLQKMNKVRGSWPVAYRWLATGTLAIYTACGCKIVSAAPFQEPARPAGVQPSSRSQQFDIPGGSLGTAMDAFHSATGLQITFAAEGIRSFLSPGASGILTVEQALTRLLKDSGATYRYTAANSVTIELKPTNTTVVVNESVGGEISPKYSRPVREIPQSISVVSKQLIQDQGATTLRDALRNVAGISLAAGEGGAQGDNLTIRGFTARNDIFNDGMRDFGSYYRDPFNVEEVDVLKGPTGTTFGRGTTGGALNQTTKSARLDHFFSGSIQGGSDKTRRVTADINQPFSALGNGAAFRLNMMGNDSNVAGRDIAENRRFGLAPSLALGLGSATRTTFNYFHQSEDDIPDYGIPWLFNGPAPVKRNLYYGFKDGNFLKTTADIGTIRLEHDFSPHITFHNQVRYANYERDARITEARTAGTPALATPLSAIQVTRNQIAVSSIETFLDDQADISMRFETGRLRHTFVAGVEAGRETSDPTRFTYSGVPGTTLLNPDENQLFTGVPSISSKVKTTGVSVGAYVLDTVQLSRKWEASGGVRWDRFDADYQQTAGAPAAFRRVDNMVSYRGSITYRPNSHGNVYFSYGTSANPSAEALSLSAATVGLPPERNRTFEAGSKWDLLSSRLALSGALFRTEKLNARETDPNNPLLNILSGNQRVNGLEFSISAKATKNLQISSSYALLDSRLVASRGFPDAVGSRLANVPRNTFNLWTTYDFPWRIHLGGGAIFVDRRTASSTVPLDPTTGLVKEVPSYWVFNLMASRPVAEHVDAQFNVYNLANRYYYDQVHPGHLVPGVGRSALLGFRFHF